MRRKVTPLALATVCAGFSHGPACATNLGVKSCHQTAVALLTLAVVLLFSPVTAAFALGRLPLIAEDPSSPCASTVDAAIAYPMELVGPGGDSSTQQQFRSHVDMGIPLVHLNYGITDRIQGRIRLRVPLTTVAPNDGGLAVGFGDMSAGLKYRFMDQIDGREYGDTCDPQQSEAPYGLQGPVSVSVFPQFNLPTGSVSRGLGSGEYSVEIPVDIAREFGKLYVIGEVDFVWRYHNHSSPNGLEGGIAVSYALSSKWSLLSEQRLDSATSGRGPTLWLMDLGAVYQLNQYVMLFGATGSSVAATFTVQPVNFATIVGTRLTIPIRW